MGFLAFLFGLSGAVLAVLLVVVHLKSAAEIQKLARIVSFQGERLDILSKYERIEDIDAAIDKRKSEMSDRRLKTDARGRKRPSDSRSTTPHPPPAGNG